jgi:hypothetical protein
MTGLPPISEADIEDKSKGDFFLKATAMVQILWLSIKVVARWVKHLPVTQLEVSALAFSFSTLVTFAFWWNKPQGINEPTII